MFSEKNLREKNANSMYRSLSVVSQLLVSFIRQSNPLVSLLYQFFQEGVSSVKDRLGVKSTVYDDL